MRKNNLARTTVWMWAFAAVASLSRAQTPNASATVEAAIQELTAGHSREWVLKQVRTIMGRGGCVQGEVYRFAKDRTVTEERCVSGLLQKTQQHWALAEEGPADMVVRIDGVPYHLLFYGAKHDRRMTLRQIALTKTTETVDLEFHLEEE